MAFASTITDTKVAGDERETRGTFANTGGSTGGNIDTGLEICESLVLQHIGSAVVASAPVVNETFPVAGSAVTVVTVADTTGVWVAKGR